MSLTWLHHAPGHRGLCRAVGPTLPPDHRAMLRSHPGHMQAPGLPLSPERQPPCSRQKPCKLRVALRRRLRLRLPIASGRCGPSPGCGGPVDLFGDHALACPRTGLLARRRAGMDPSGARGSGTRRPHCPAAMAGTHNGSPRRPDRPSLPGLAHLWVDAQRDCMVLRRHARFAVDANGPAAAMRRRCRCALPSGANGQHTRNLRPPARSASSYLGRRWGGRWNGGALGLVRDLVRVRAFRAPPAVRRILHPVGGRAAGRSWHGPRLCLADGLVDVHGRRTAGTRVSGRGCRQQAATPGVASPAEAAQLKTGGFVG